MVDELEDYSHIIFNIMSKPSLATPLNKYLIIGGALGAAYAFFTYLSSRKASKELSLAATRQILKEVKYQIYTFCIPFAEAVSDKLKGGNQPKDLENYFKSELAKGYGVKEDLIISKYSASKEEYAAALQNYRKDKEVKEGQAEIIKILEDTVKGRIDLTVPAPVHDSLFRLLGSTLPTRSWPSTANSSRTSRSRSARSSTAASATIPPSIPRTTPSTSGP
jgi:hypothetical protein